jgi:cell wall-associated NlpC family hydrolase
MSASVITPAVNFYAKPDNQSALETQLLFGEEIEIESESQGWAYGTCQTDNYRGFIETKNLTKEFSPPTHIITAPRTIVYQAPSAKAAPLGLLPITARVLVEKENQGEGGTHFAKTPTGFIPQAHCAPLDLAQYDFVSTALALLGTPYIWGGRDSTRGIDCSALLQLALAIAGIKAPRNSAEQEKFLGKPLTATEPLERGDLIFWQAHIGIMVDSENLLHANAFHMAVAVEDFATAKERIQNVVGPVRALKRL